MVSQAEVEQELARLQDIDCYKEVLAFGDQAATGQADQAAPSTLASQPTTRAATQAASSASKTAAPVIEEPNYPAFKDKALRVQDHTCGLYGLPNRGTLRFVEDSLAKYNLMPVSNSAFVF